MNILPADICKSDAELASVCVLASRNEPKPNIDPLLLDPALVWAHLWR